MKDPMELSRREKPGHTIFHVGTNDLNSDRPSDLLTKSIVHLVITLKDNSQNVSISNIIMQNDSFNKKAMEVNGYLKQLCVEKNIFLVDHTKTIHSRNINKSKLHLNKLGNIILLRQHQVFCINIK